MPIDVEQFYRKYGPMVLRRCRFLLRDEDHALDAMQEVFIRILRKKDQLEERAPSSLLYVTATRVCLNMLRKNKRLVHSEELLLAVPSTEDTERSVLTGHFLEKLFDEEKETTKLIAVLHYIDKLTLEETAEFIGLSVSGVRKRLRRLREKSLQLKEA